MKTIKYSILAPVAALGFLLASCDSNPFLDHYPQDSWTDAAYFTQPEHFKEYTASLHGQLHGWWGPQVGYDQTMDVSSDLSSTMGQNADMACGTIVIPAADSRWDKCYSNIRAVNLLFDNLHKYKGDVADIQQYLGQAYFFRAYNYFYLLKFFGGVPVVLSALDTDSPELYAPRNSRYEVIDQILSDLTKACEWCPSEAMIPASDKGRVSAQGAKAFKARVLLYEATWRKYVGTTTDFEGSAGPEKNQINDFLIECIDLCNEVVNANIYSVWNYNSLASFKNMSYRYLFCIEGENSNPGGYTKSSNREFILKQLFDFDVKPGGVNLNQTIGKMNHSRKLMDMYLCTDGLPIEVSPLFMGYANPLDEFKNRDYRMKSIVDYDNQDIKTLTTGGSGYGCLKWTSVNYTLKESADYPVLRLPEVYLNLCEALWERDGQVSDVVLNRTINLERARAGVAGLTNALVATIKDMTKTNKSLSEVMRDEIRRERALELYMEGFRFDDLKRWGIAEEALNADHLGTIVGGAGYPTVFKDASGKPTSRYTATAYDYGEVAVPTVWGNLNAVCTYSKENIKFERTHYLWPLPYHQIQLNNSLVQNPGYK